MKRFISVLAVPLALLFVPAAVADDTGSPLAFLHGTWTGQGTTRGMPATLSLTWSPALDSQFTRLELENRMQSASHGTIHFQGLAHYRLDQQAESAITLTGVWLDNQGAIHAITGRLEERALVANWGNKATEQGRSTYRINEAGDLVVTDEVLDDGQWRRFGHALLVRDGESGARNVAPEFGRG